MGKYKAVNIDEETYQKIKGFAVEEDRTINSVIRRAVALYPQDGKLVTGKRVVVAKHADGSMQISPELEEGEEK